MNLWQLTEVERAIQGHMTGNWRLLSGVWGTGIEFLMNHTETHDSYRIRESLLKGRCRGAWRWARSSSKRVGKGKM